MGDSVCDYALTFFLSGILLKVMNDTSLQLIPKVKYPESLLLFRLISLCDVGYKVNTKTLTNKLKELIMADLTAPSQSSFVLGLNNRQHYHLSGSSSLIV